MEQELEMRTLFHEEGIPAGLGSEIGRRYNAALANPPSDTDLYFSRQTAATALQKVWGAHMEKNLEIAKGEVRRMAAKQPKIYQMLEYSGLGNDPWVIQTIFNIARGKGRVK
ncbi:MAG TPA: hypothetical protein VJ486_06995 [Geothrix sp.]|nr:hypothetical protein [Geothrix sp.]